MALEVMLPTGGRPLAGSADEPGASGGTGARPSTDLVIALVNNMPDPALEGTEAQFNELLLAASSGHRVRLKYSAIPEMPRGPGAAARIRERYWPIEEIFRDPPDALIVTGTEPRQASLTEEPYWDRLVDLISFARTRTRASVWSCLAAHVAVLALDGIERRRLAVKCTGVFEHAVLAGHRLTAGLPPMLPMPHSRWNELPLAPLTAAGYTVLTWSRQTGADAFLKDGASPMLFVQGHPEYQTRTILKEYQRDVQRFVSGEEPVYPTLPSGYFGAKGEALLLDFELRLRAGALEDPVASFPYLAVAETLVNTWSGPAARMFANWLDLVAAQPKYAAP